MKAVPHKIPVWIKQLYPNRLWKITQENTNTKCIYLTFDDGPIPKVTPWVLDVLEEYEAKATFFWIGDNVQKHPIIAKQVIDNGHQIGNHTYHHTNGWHTHINTYLDEVDLADKTIKQYGVSTDLFRPPYGRLRTHQAKQLHQLNYKIVMWDVLSKDYIKSKNPQRLLKKTIQATESGSIVVFHDSIKAFANLQQILPEYLKHFKQQGFVFKKL